MQITLTDREKTFFGAGFWDRPEIYGEHNAKRFTKVSESFGEAYAQFEG